MGDTYYGVINAFTETLHVVPEKHVRNYRSEPAGPNGFVTEFTLSSGITKRLVGSAPDLYENIGTEAKPLYRTVPAQAMQM